eukprot:766987-Hanusia_phi.AAC.3
MESVGLRQTRGLPLGRSCRPVRVRQAKEERLERAAKRQTSGGRSRDGEPEGGERRGRLRGGREGGTEEVHVGWWIYVDHEGGEGKVQQRPLLAHPEGKDSACRVGAVGEVKLGDELGDAVESWSPAEDHVKEFLGEGETGSSRVDHGGPVGAEVVEEVNPAHLQVEDLQRVEGVAQVVGGGCGDDGDRLRLAPLHGEDPGHPAGPGAEEGGEGSLTLGLALPGVANMVEEPERSLGVVPVAELVQLRRRVVDDADVCPDGVEAGGA